MKRKFLSIAALIGLWAGLGLGLGLDPAAVSQAKAEPAYNETGWRAATSDEQRLRDIFDRGKGDWSKDDGIPEMFDCMVAWGIWADTARRTNDSFPTISGHLSHAFAEGQLSHYLNSLFTKVEGDVDQFTELLFASAERIDTTIPTEDKKLMRYMGKCFVHPSSWDMSHGATMTGPEFMRDLLMQPDAVDAYPVYVKNAEYRAEFDRLILTKDFAAAANFAAQLHADPALKSTVYWHEVLAASELAASSGRGTELSAPLLSTLTKVWWPKWKRGWARNLLRMKQGLPTEQQGRSATMRDPGEEPAWAKMEWERFLRGETNYTVCNTWHRNFC